VLRSFFDASLYQNKHSGELVELAKAVGAGVVCAF
jgi:hypothetical protein